MNIGGEEGSSNSPEPIPEADLAIFFSGISAWIPESSDPQPSPDMPLLASRRYLPCVRKGGIAITIASDCPRTREEPRRAFAESSGAAADLAGCAAMDIVLILARQRQDLWDLVIEAEVWRVDATPATHSPPGISTRESIWADSIPVGHARACEPGLPIQHSAARRQHRRPGSCWTAARPPCSRDRYCRDTSSSRFSVNLAGSLGLEASTLPSTFWFT